MRLIKGKYKYRIKNCKQILQIHLVRKRYNVYLQNRPLDFQLPPTSKIGIPTSYSYLNDELEFYPIPDKQYNVRVIYTELKIK